MLELKRRQLEIKMPSGEVLKMNFPTLGQVEAFQKKGEGVKLEEIKAFFAELGMNEDHFAQLESAHVQAIIESFVEVKKN